MNIIISSSMPQATVETEQFLAQKQHTENAYNQNYSET